MIKIILPKMREWTMVGWFLGEAFKQDYCRLLNDLLHKRIEEEIARVESVTSNGVSIVVKLQGQEYSYEFVLSELNKCTSVTTADDMAGNTVYTVVFTKTTKDFEGYDIEMLWRILEYGDADNNPKLSLTQILTQLHRELGMQFTGKISTTKPVTNINEKKVEENENGKE